MDAVGKVLRAPSEVAVFQDYPEAAAGWRQPVKLAPSLDKTLPSVLLAVLAGADGITDVARLEVESPTRRRFRTFAHGYYAPLGDTLPPSFLTPSSPTLSVGLGPSPLPPNCPSDASKQVPLRTFQNIRTNNIYALHSK